MIFILPSKPAGGYPPPLRVSSEIAIAAGRALVECAPGYMLGVHILRGDPQGLPVNGPWYALGSFCPGRSFARVLRAIPLGPADMRGPVVPFQPWWRLSLPGQVARLVGIPDDPGYLQDLHPGWILGAALDYPELAAAGRLEGVDPSTLPGTPITG